MLPAVYSTLPGLKLISQGAEACVYTCEYKSQWCVIKHRMSKAYRHPTLDERLTRERHQGESRTLTRARKLGIPVPTLYHSDPPNGCLIMECVPGPTVKAWLQGGGGDGPFAAAVAAHVGAAVAKLHASGLAHGDLTTSNMVLRGVAGGRDPWDASMVRSGSSGTDTNGWGLLPQGGGEVAAAVSGSAQFDPADDSGEEEEGGLKVDPAESDAQMAALSGVGTSTSGAGSSSSSAATADAPAPPASTPASAQPGEEKPPPPPLPALPTAASECVLIDFGLATQAANLEDMGVDLYVLERALTSAHAKHATGFFAVVLDTYTAHLTALAPKHHVGAKAVAGKFATVRQRGRKRVAFG